MAESSAGFRDLIVWQKAEALAVAVVRGQKGSPRDRYGDVLRFQLVRAAGSVPANIAEGYGRYSAGAYRNHLSIARGSLFEAESWIDLLHKSGYLDEGEAGELLRLCGEVGRLLTSLMKGTQPAFPPRIREETADYDAFASGDA